MNNKNNKEQVKETLVKFQNGYEKRNIDEVNNFVNELFVDSDNTLIIGTGNGEWCKGLEEIKELIQIDWFYWGNFELDLNNVFINANDEFATVATTAVLQKEYQDGKLSELNINRIRTIIDSESTDSEKIYKSLKSIAYFLHEENIGNDVKRKVRFSASLKNENGNWKFSDIHFSYPVSPPTDIKILTDK